MESKIKTEKDIIGDLAKEQRFLKKKRILLNQDIQKLYDRWKRNGVRTVAINGVLTFTYGVDIQSIGSQYVPLEAVKPLSKLISKLGKVDRSIKCNKSLIKVLTEIRKEIEL